MARPKDLIPSFLLTKEQQRVAIEMAAEGESITRIIEELCVTPMAFWQFRQHDPKFQDFFEQARQDGLESIADTLLTIPDTYADVQRGKLKSDNIKWLLSKRKPQVYGDKLELNVHETIDLNDALSQAKSRAATVVPTEGVRIRDAALNLPSESEDEGEG